MEDFGDYIGQQGQQFTSQILSQVMMEVRMERRMVHGQGIAEAANREAAIFKDAVDNGSNATYDFTDGKVNTVTFDLSPYEIGDDPVANRGLALESLKKCLDENGFDPGELVAIHGSPNKFIYSFDDTAADRMERVMFSWIDKACEAGGIAEKLGVNERFYQVCGFGEMGQEGRIKFYDALYNLFTSNGVDPGEISVSLNKDGSLAGDISVPVERKWLLEEACKGVSGELGSRLVPMYSFLPADSMASFDETYSNAVALSKSMLRKGFDGKMTVLQNGSTLIEVDPGGVPDLRDLIDAYNTDIAEVAYRRSQHGAGLLDRAGKGMPSAKELFKHARAAEEALKADAAARGAERLQEGIGKAAERTIAPPVI